MNKLEQGILGMLEEIFSHSANVYHTRPVSIEAWQTTKEIIIPTLEGNMTASPGDYIIKGLEGEFYPCKPEIFKQKYRVSVRTIPAVKRIEE